MNKLLIFTGLLCAEMCLMAAEPQIGTRPVVTSPTAKTAGVVPEWDGTDWRAATRNIITNLTVNGVSTNNAVRETSLTRLTASVNTITMSWTNGGAYIFDLTADTTIALANATGTNRTITLYARPDGTHSFTWPSGITALTQTNQPFGVGLTPIYFDRLDGTNYLSVGGGGINASNITGGTIADARLITPEADVASATTTDLGAVTNRNVRITGTTTITSFGTVAAGTMRWGRFAGALTFTHSGTALILPTAANITTVANDRFTAVSLGSGNWLVYSYQRADGTALAGSGGAPGGSDTQIQYNSSSSFAGSSSFTIQSASPMLARVATAPAANAAPSGGYEVVDSTVASSGNQQYSPGIYWEGQGWKTTATAASQSVRFRTYVVPVQGTTAPTGLWTMESSVAGGAFGSSVTISTSGSILASGGITSLSTVAAASGSALSISSRSRITSSADGAFEFSNAAATARSTAQFSLPSSIKTSNYTVQVLDSGLWFNNDGAAGAVTNTLPTAAVGMQFAGSVLAAQIFAIKPQAGDRIISGVTVGSTGGEMWSLATNSVVHMYCPKLGLWLVTRQIGAWTQN